MVAAVEPVAAGVDDVARTSAEPQTVQVLHHDVCTVLPATDPTTVPTALRRVPTRRR
ncbi:hypothetical protein LUW75_11120 [Streptomyces sp. MRC013]|uniref:hypothetical protein n=1 Tax=Streptomyces sp. MRC013 TaxID=2898276 RepID=UPI00202741A2|nr:hypothetical protein [Streptomyces sp. MRC013]URM90460.1 hypothetical protein LUW75_11120 [Streptomyces sp. MRC013]